MDEFNRVTNEDDDRKQAPAFVGLSLSLPNTQPLEKPLTTLCYNVEWAPIIHGWLSWLATIAPWPLGTDESSEAIQGILKILGGDSCDMFVLSDELCTLITSCVESSTTLQQTIYNTTQVTNTESLTFISAIADDNLTGLIDPCDDDVLYGRILSLWDFIDTQNRDFLQQLAASLAGANLLSGLIADLTFLNEFSVFAVIEFLTELDSVASANYNNQVTTNYRDEVTCALFCLAKTKDCTLSLRDVYNYFVRRGGYEVEIEDNPPMDDFFQLATTAVLPTTDWPSLLTIWQLATVMYGYKFYDAPDARRYQLEMAYASPSGLHNGLCDCAPDYVAGGTWSIYDFSSDASGFTTAPGTYYQEGYGFRGDGSETSQATVYLTIGGNRVSGVRAKFRNDVTGDFIVINRRSLANSQNLGVKATYPMTSERCAGKILFSMTSQPILEFKYPVNVTLVEVSLRYVVSGSESGIPIVTEVTVDDCPA